MFVGERLKELEQNVSGRSCTEARVPTVCSLSCQNSFSRAWSKKGKLRTWCTKMYLSKGSSESSGSTSPASDLKGAPNLCNAVGDASSQISHSVCCAINSRFKSVHQSAGALQWTHLCADFSRSLATYSALVCRSRQIQGVVWIVSRLWSRWKQMSAASYWRVWSAVTRTQEGRRALPVQYRSALILV